MRLHLKLNCEVQFPLVHKHTKKRFLIMVAWFSRLNHFWLKSHRAQISWRFPQDLIWKSLGSSKGEIITEFSRYQSLISPRELWLRFMFSVFEGVFKYCRAEMRTLENFTNWEIAKNDRGFQRIANKNWLKIKLAWRKRARKQETKAAKPPRTSDK